MVTVADLTRTAFYNGELVDRHVASDLDCLAQTPKIFRDVG